MAKDESVIESNFSYYKFVPQPRNGVVVADGVYDNPHFGELVPGRTLEVRPDQVGLVVNDPDFEKSSKKQYDNQLESVAHERARLAQPAA